MCLYKKTNYNLTTDYQMLIMSSSKFDKFFDVLKQCKIKENNFYILQGRMFDFIFANQIFQKKLVFQKQYKLDDLKPDKYDCMSEFFLRDRIFKSGGIYWLSKDNISVKVHKLKDFNASNYSYEILLVKLLFHFGVAYSFENKTTVEDHFVCLELLKHCLILAEGLELSVYSKNIQAIALLCFLIQVTNVFKTGLKTNLQQNNKKIDELIKYFDFPLFSSRVSQSQSSLLKLQSYLSFLDGYIFRFIDSVDKIYQRQSVPYVTAIKNSVNFVMFCDLLLFVQTSNENQLYVFRQSFCSYEIQDFYEKKV